MRPIPTKYRGVTYRSRVEARWAVFFEAMGWAATYEQEGLDLDGVWYLPDFWLPALGVYAEIKADAPTQEEAEKCQRLADASSRTVWLLAGSPTAGAYKLHEFAKGRAAANPALREFRDCRRCERTVIYHRSGDNTSWGWQEIGERCGRADCGDREPGFFGRVDKALAGASDERFGVHDKP